MSLSPPFFKSTPSKDLTFALVFGRYNEILSIRFKELVFLKLLEAGVQKETIKDYSVPGATEIPYLISRLIHTQPSDVYIALGVVIAGETQHHQVIQNTTAFAFQTLSMESGYPIVNGIIIAKDEKQATDRIQATHPRFEYLAKTAIEMANHRKTYL